MDEIKELIIGCLIFLAIIFGVGAFLISIFTPKLPAIFHEKKHKQESLFQQVLSWINLPSTSFWIIFLANIVCDVFIYHLCYQVFEIVPFLMWLYLCFLIGVGSLIILGFGNPDKIYLRDFVLLLCSCLLVVLISSTGFFGFVIGFACIDWLGVYYMNNSEQKQAKIEKEIKVKRDISARKRKIEIIGKIVKKHYNALQKKYQMLVYTDDYGTVQNSDWRKELQYFIEHVFSKDVSWFKPSIEDIENAFLKLNGNSEKLIEISVKNPLDFEERCRQILQSLGYQARTTKKSGDQGVDVVATKNNQTIVLQCKLYHSPVGNKAVQEVTAGRTYYKADYAAVVTNNTYTKSARQLASNCDVLLLHINDLEHIDELIGASKAIPQKATKRKKK